MSTDSSASAHEHTPHANQTTRTATINNALKERALAVLNDESIDVQGRAILRHALETNDPWLARIVAQAEAGESTNQPTSEVNENDSRRRVEALAEIICAGGDESSAALLVLMAAIQNSTDPTALAHTAKHFAFTRCGELNVRGMVDEQIAVLEREMFHA